jgi:hypothetical protein
MTRRAQKSVSVRLEGGLGDHILGMRVLPFIRERRPYHDIVVYSDSGGHPVQMQVAEMSPLVARVVPVYAEPKGHNVVGRLENIRSQDLALMLATDLFIDAWGGDMFITAAAALQVPVFDIFAARPVFKVPNEDERCAARLLGDFAGASFVGMNLSKYGAGILKRHERSIVRLLHGILEHPKVIVLNMFTSSYEFAHWPEPQRTLRRQYSIEEVSVVRSLSTISDRVVPCADLPLCTVAALLKRCSYFVGVDNGVKHLAWALDVPHTFFVPERPRVLGTLRWIPDVHRMLFLDCSDDLLDAHIATAHDVLRCAGSRVTAP